MIKNLLTIIICLFLASCTQTVLVEKPHHGPPPQAKAWGLKKKQREYYYYYPSSNVYFDVSFGQYVYLNGGSWVRVNTLPSTIRLGNSSRIRIDYEGDDVYVNNSNHKAKYKSIPPGQAKKMGYNEDDRGNQGNGNGHGKGKKKGHDD